MSTGQSVHAVRGMQATALTWCICPPFSDEA